MKKSQLLAAVKSGSAQADKVLAQRKKALVRRESSIKRKIRTEPLTAAMPQKLMLAAGSASPDVLLAEGDSWFDYPFYDVLKILEDDHGFDVESVAHKGDAIEQMAYGDGQLDDLTRLLEKLLRSNRVPRAILLSGGGNDVAGVEFEMLLNHSLSEARGINEQVLEGVVGERIMLAYAFIIGSITRACEGKVGAPIKILVHGYDYPVPDGRGFLGGWSILPGPWLEPGFRHKGYDDLIERIEIVKGMIDRLNRMLAELTALPQFSHVTYIDLRKTLSVGADYKKWWGNELHPTERGFKKVAQKFAEAI
jgi:hypothetical protein